MLDRVQSLARVHRNRQRPPANGFIERAPEYRARELPARMRASDKTLTYLGSLHDCWWEGLLSTITQITTSLPSYVQSLRTNSERL